MLLHKIALFSNVRKAMMIGVAETGMVTILLKLRLMMPVIHPLHSPNLHTSTSTGANLRPHHHQVQLRKYIHPVATVEKREKFLSSTMVSLFPASA